MPKRTDTLLTDYATPIAEEMVKRTGSVKLTLSAGVIALKMLSPENREKAIAIANGLIKLDENYRATAGIDLTPRISESELREKITEIVEASLSHPEEKKHEKKAKPLRAG